MSFRWKLQIRSLSAWYLLDHGALLLLAMPCRSLLLSIQTLASRFRSQARTTFTCSDTAKRYSSTHIHHTFQSHHHYTNNPPSAHTKALGTKHKMEIIAEITSGLRIALIISGSLLAFIALCISLYTIGANLGAPLILPFVPSFRNLFEDTNYPQLITKAEQQRKDEVEARRVGACLLLFICYMTTSLELATREKPFFDPRGYEAHRWLAAVLLKGCLEGVVTMMVLRGVLQAVQAVRSRVVACPAGDRVRPLGTK